MPADPLQFNPTVWMNGTIVTDTAIDPKVLAALAGLSVETESINVDQINADLQATVPGKDTVQPLEVTGNHDNADNTTRDFIKGLARTSVAIKFTLTGGSPDVDVNNLLYTVQTRASAFSDVAELPDMFNPAQWKITFFPTSAITSASTFS